MEVPISLSAELVQKVIAKAALVPVEGWGVEYADTPLIREIRATLVSQYDQPSLKVTIRKRNGYEIEIRGTVEGDEVRATAHLTTYGNELPRILELWEAVWAKHEAGQNNRTARITERLSRILD